MFERILGLYKELAKVARWSLSASRSGKNTLAMGLFILFACAGCGHTSTARMGLISFGKLEGKVIPENPGGPVLTGSMAPDITQTAVYSLSEAAHNVLKDTGYDTLVDVEVTSETGLFPWNNKIILKGTGLRSSDLPAGDAP